MKIIERLNELNITNTYPFHMPGHKRRMADDDRLKDLYKIDITEIDGFDNLHNATGILRESMDKCAEVFGADEAFYLVNGTTGGILAAVTGCVKEGDYIIAARNCHRSVYNAAMLSGAEVSYIVPEKEDYFEINAGITPSQVENALGKLMDQQGRKLVVITSPTYEGIVSDVSEIARICHNYGAILLVDAAHGAHLGFSEYFPASAQSQGADLVVVSTHKTLPAATQTALIFINSSLDSILRDRVKRMLGVFMTSSPSYVLMASIDECVDILSKEADRLFKRYEERLIRLYDAADKFANISVLTKEKLEKSGSYDFDPSKIVVMDKSGTFTGKDLSDMLMSKYMLQSEMSLAGNVLLMTSIADNDEGINRLIEALEDIDYLIAREEVTYEENRGFFRKIFDEVSGRLFKSYLFNLVSSLGEDNFGIKQKSQNDNFVREMTIKEAVYTDSIEEVPLELSEGKISADYIVCYPPCVPDVVPGEVLSAEVIDNLLGAKKMGTSIMGLSEDGTIKVIWEK